MTLLDGWTSPLDVAMLMGILSAISSSNPNPNVHPNVENQRIGPHCWHASGWHEI
jgi:hypothetical protein